jgi:hypothetical protein
VKCTPGCAHKAELDQDGSSCQGLPQKGVQPAGLHMQMASADCKVHSNSDYDR